MELFWSVFSRIRTEYGEILRISPYSFGMRENADRNNYEHGHFSRSTFCIKYDEVYSSQNIFINMFLIVKSRTLALFGLLQYHENVVSSSNYHQT